MTLSDFDAAFVEASKDPLKPSANLVTIEQPEVTIVKPTEASVVIRDPTPEEIAATAAAATAAATAPAAPAAPVTPDPASTVLEQPTPEEVAAVAAQPQPEPNDEPKLSDRDFMARFATLMKTAAPEIIQPQPVAQPQPQPQEQPLFSQEEMGLLTQYYTDWPEVAKAQEIMLRGMMTNTARQLMTDIASTLAPYLETITALATNAQVSELEAKVPDYDKVVEQLPGWIEKQPAYLRPAYTHVIQNGTSADVADLIDRYRQSIGAAGPATQQPPVAGATVQTTQPKKAATELSPAARQAAAALAPISSKRANASSATISPNDFDGAFKQFAEIASV